MRRLTELMRLMPPVAQKYWDKGISYHDTLRHYDGMDKVPLKITVKLITPYKPAVDQAINLDSLLSYIVANDVRAPATAVDGKVFPLPLALLWVSDKGYPLWACSELKPESWHQESVEYWHKRLSEKHLIDWAKKPSVKNVGAVKDYRVPLGLVITDKLVAYAIGNADETQRLLSYAHFLGKKHSIGYGRVVDWQVEPFEGDVLPLILANRAVPAEYLGISERCALGGWSPPYWDNTRHLPVIRNHCGID